MLVSGTRVAVFVSIIVLASSSKADALNGIGSGCRIRVFSFWLRPCGSIARVTALPFFVADACRRGWDGDAGNSHRAPPVLVFDMGQRPTQVYMYVCIRISSGCVCMCQDECLASVRMCMHVST